MCLKPSICSPTNGNRSLQKESHPLLAIHIWLLFRDPIFMFWGEQKVVILVKKDLDSKTYICLILVLYHGLQLWCMVKALCICIIILMSKLVQNICLFSLRIMNPKKIPMKWWFIDLIWPTLNGRKWRFIAQYLILDMELQLAMMKRIRLPSFLEGHTKEKLRLLAWQMI